jgi:prepilin-type N-terminal cleavage/methylation domain-containing protein
MRRGFSMLELVIVVVIIAIIAAIAVPRMSSAAEHSKFASTRASFTTFQKAMLLYQATYATYPAAIPAGMPPTVVHEFISESDWTTPPALGGTWIWMNSGLGQTGIGISNPTVTPAVLTAFDTQYDDGNLTGGTFQVIGTTYVMLLDRGLQAQQATQQATEATGN